MSIFLGDKNLGVELVKPHGNKYYEQLEIIQSIVSNHNKQAKDESSKIQSIFEKYSVAENGKIKEDDPIIFQVFAYIPETEEFILIEPFYRFLVKMPSKYCILEKHNHASRKEGIYWLKLK